MIRFSDRRKFSLEPYEFLSGLLILYLRVQTNSQNGVFSHIVFIVLIGNLGSADKENIPNEFSISIFHTNIKSEHINKNPVVIENHRGKFTILEKAIDNNQLLNLVNDIQPQIKAEIKKAKLIEKQLISNNFLVGNSDNMELELEIERKLESRCLSSIRFHLKKGQQFFNGYQVLGDYFIDANSLLGYRKRYLFLTNRFFKSKKNVGFVKKVINLVKNEIKKVKKLNAESISSRSITANPYENSDSVLNSQTRGIFFNPNNKTRDDNKKKENLSQDSENFDSTLTSTPMKTVDQSTPPEHSKMSTETTRNAALGIKSNLNSSTEEEEDLNDTSINHWNEKTNEEKFPAETEERDFRRNKEKNSYQRTSLKMIWPLFTFGFIILLIIISVYSTTIARLPNNQNESEKSS